MRSKTIFLPSGDQLDRCPTATILVPSTPSAARRCRAAQLRAGCRPAVRNRQLPNVDRLAAGRRNQCLEGLVIDVQLPHAAIEQRGDDPFGDTFPRASNGLSGSKGNPPAWSTARPCQLQPPRTESYGPCRRGFQIRSFFPPSKAAPLPVKNMTRVLPSWDCPAIEKPAACS